MPVEIPDRVVEAACETFLQAMPQGFSCSNGPAPGQFQHMMRAALAAAEAEAGKPRPLSDWTEEVGDVLWWRFPIEEAPWIGSPLSVGHTVEVWTRDAPETRVVCRGYVGGWPGYHTHWTPLPSMPENPDAP